MFIAAGEWQPVDFKIIGSLKERAKAEFDMLNLVVRNGDELTINCELALDILAQCWNEISAGEVMKFCPKLDDYVNLYDVEGDAEEFQ